MKRTALLLGAAMALGFPQHGMAGTETVATTGDNPGGTHFTAEFDTFANPVLNSTGQVAYLATLDTGSTFVTSLSDTGLWLDDTLVAREGSQAGGAASGAVFSSFFDYGVNDAGQVGYEAFLRIGAGGVTSSNDNGLWLDGAITSRDGSLAGGVSGGAVFSTFGPPALNSAGQTAYFATMQTGIGGINGTNDRGIWRDTTLIAREGAQAGDVAAGGVFAGFGGIALNNAGQVAYEGFLQTFVGGVTSTDDSGVWLGSTLVAREGSQAGGVSSGAVFSSFADPSLNDLGQVVYRGFLLVGAGGVESDNNSGIWRDSTLIAREGSQAGGVASGAVFNNLGDPLINNTGHVVYTATLRQGAGGVVSTNDFGIWRNSTLLVREGSQAAGAPDGAVFRTIGSPGLNDIGQVVHSGSLLQGTGGVDLSNDGGLWIVGTNGESLLVAREGETLAGRTISGLTIESGSGGADGRGRAVNNFSQVTYRATFTNGDQGVFLYTPDLHWNTTFSSSWDIASRWTLGQLPGEPHDVFIDPDVSLSVTGPSQDVTVDNLTIGGNHGIATLRLNGGTISTPGAGRVTIEANGILTGDGIIGGNGGIINRGTVIADNLAVESFFTNQGLVTGDGRIDAGILNTAGSSEIRVAAGDHLRITGPSASVTNFGRIENLGGELEVSGLVSNRAGTGLIVGENATFRFNGGLNNDSGVGISFGTSRFFGDIDNTGSIVLSGGSNTTFYDDVTNNGSIVVAAAGNATSTAVFFGDVSGAGSITGGGNVFLHGDLRPGNSPAAVHHDAHLFLMATANTQIELAGTNPGSQHDQVNNLKSTTLGGTLDIQLINGFDPEQGDTFDIFNLATSTGTFADILLPLLDTGLGWHLGRLYTDGELHVELEGDLNQDGFVGAADLDILLAHWGDSALAYDYAAGDASGDGLVGQADLAIVQANFGAGTPGGNVPEPGAAAVLGLMGLLAGARRRRQ
ncbi:PEP-CTERM sorting domain-containing protein [Phycisphaeraceae bacterium D3-23]